MQVTKREAARQENLELLLAALAGAKEYKPGAVNRRILAALARIPWLTPEVIARPRLAPLARRVGLTAHVVEVARERQARAPEDISREKGLLEELATMVRHTNPTRDDVVGLLLFGRRPSLARVLVEAEELRASRIGRAGAAERHADDNRKSEAIRASWATGEFSSRNLCANEKYEHLDMSFETARKALRNTPNPDPWPAKPQHKGRNTP